MRYPKPYKLPGSPYYSFMYLDRATGRRRIKSTGASTRDEADPFIREFMDNLRTPVSALTFEAYAAPYFIWESCPRVTRRRDEGKQIGRTHVRKSRVWLDTWVIPDITFSQRPIVEITRGDILDLRSRLRKKCPGTNTLNKAIAAVKTVLSEAAFRGDIPADPGARVGNIAYQARERGAFTVDEVRKILALETGDMADKRMRAAITFLFCTGVRVGELRALQWSQIDGTRVSVHQAFKDSRELGGVKWDKSRQIILPQLVLGRLPPRGRPRAFVFGHGRRALGIEGLKNAFARVIAAAEIPAGRWLTPHSCRHTLNSVLLAAGVSPLTVQAYMGWSSQENRILTRVQSQYTHMQLLRLEDVAEKVDELFGARQVAVSSTG